MKYYLPEFPEQRYYKFKMGFARWKTLVIDKTTKLERYIAKYKPTDIYYSACRYRFPIEVERPRSKLKGCFISGDLALDFDDVKLSHVMNAVHYVQLNYPKLEYKYCLKTKEDHYQAVFYVPMEFYQKDSKLKNFSRRFAFNQFVEKVYKDILRKKFQIDGKLTKKFNQRVIRLPCSPRILKDKSVFIPQFVDIPLLREGGARDSMRKNPRSIYRDSFLRSPLLTGSKDSWKMKEINPCKNKWGARYLAPSSPQYFYRWYTSSKVPGTKDRHILYLTYPHMNIGILSKKLKRLAFKENLGEFYLFGDGNFLRAICGKSLPWRKVVKITMGSKSLEKKEIRKMKQRFIPLSDVYDEKDKVIKTHPSYLKTIKGCENNSHYSKKHLQLFKAMGAKVNIPQGQMVGNLNLNLMYQKYEYVRK